MTATTQGRKRVQLLEIAKSDSGSRVDRNAGIIRGVKILGKHSKNGRIYSDNALRKAAKLYEGVEVNIDHPSRSAVGRERGLSEGFGVLKNVRRDNNGVYGDLYYLKSHPMAEQICERAEKFPRQIGLSHNAVGSIRRERGHDIVEDLELVRSVDLVGKPATNSTLFESEDMQLSPVEQMILNVVRNGEMKNGEKLKKIRTILNLEVDDAALTGGTQLPDEEDEGPVLESFEGRALPAFKDSKQVLSFLRTR